MLHLATGRLFAVEGVHSRPDEKWQGPSKDLLRGSSELSGKGDPSPPRGVPRPPSLAVGCGLLSGRLHTSEAACRGEARRSMPRERADWASHALRARLEAIRAGGLDVAGVRAAVSSGSWADLEDRCGRPASLQN